MKICFLADASHPNTQNWVEYFANELKIEVSLISFNRSCRDLNKVKLYYINSIFSQSKLRYLVTISSINRLLKQIKPDILLGYRVMSYGFAAACTGFHPLVIVAQGQNIVYPENSKIKRIFAKYAVKQADFINSWAEHMTDKLVFLGADKNKILTLPRGVNTSVFNEFVQNNRLPHTMISTRALRPEYSFDQVIKSIPYVIREVKGFNYLVCGNGEAREALQSLVSKLGIENHVEFLGKISCNQLSKLLNASNLYVSAVPSDGVSSSLLEAMACGVFPLVTDNIANRMWVEDGVNGLLVSKNSPQILGECIIKALKSPELINMARQKNFKLIQEKASWRTNMKKIADLYKELLSVE